MNLSVEDKNVDLFLENLINKLFSLIAIFRKLLHVSSFGKRVIFTFF
jgi:hypothetical protein